MAHKLFRLELTPVVMMNSNLGQHSIVLNFRLPQWWAIVGNNNQFPCKQLYEMSKQNLYTVSKLSNALPKSGTDNKISHKLFGSPA